MFYSQHVLTKKGPLAKIWLAAHMQSKLTKAMVFGTDLQKAVDSIISPDAPMALRLTSNLLLGVVRILHRKTKYLLQESSDALTKLKLTFRPTAPTAVDLPASAPASNFAAVTLADASVDDLAAPMVDLSLIPARTTRPSANSAFLAADRDITIDEFAGGLAGGMLDAFALEPELDRAAGLDLADLDADAHEPLLFTPSQRLSQKAALTPSVRSDPSSVEVMRAAPASEAGMTNADAPVLSVEREAGDGAREEEEEELRLPASPTLKTPPVMPRPTEESPGVPSFGGGADGDPIVPEQDNIGLGGSARAAGRISTGSDELALADDTVDPVLEGDEQTTTAGGEGRGLPADRIEGEEDEQPNALSGEAIQERPSQLDGTPERPSEWDEARDPTVEEKHLDGEEAAGEEAEADSGRRGRKRKRAVIEDPTTELSTQAFRAFLSDTSDLLRQPRSRRRINAAGRNTQGRRAPMRYEEILSRPAIPMAPQLNELFALAFQIDEAVRQVSSPMSDADLLGAGNKDVEKETEKEGEQIGEENAADDSPSKAAEEQTPRKQAEQEGEGDSVEKERTPVKEVVADLFPVSPLPEGEEGLPPEPEGRRSSHAGSLSLPEFPDENAELEQTEAINASDFVFDSSKCYLRDVSMARSQVEQEVGAESTDVTESTISARTRKMLDYISDHLDEDGELNYTAAVTSEPGVTRRVVSRTFYELLNLSSKKALQLSQDGVYDTIRARPVEPAFGALAAAEEA